jgi:DNA-binding CsgD family transcriptional regulator/tetratricopeptide (TPR) repeat protein
LLARLDAALPLLSDGARDLPERQRTMTRAIQWSHDLLDDGERTLFQRLSVFRGGWTIDAAEAIGATINDPDWDILNTLSSLVEQSLVAVNHAPNGHTRYRMLAPIREFAVRHVEGSGDAGSISDVHAGYFLALSEQAAAGLEGSRQVEWLTRLEQDRNNLRAALDWLVDNGCADEATRLCWNLWVFLWIRGDHAEARAWMTRILEQVPDASPATRAHASGIAAAMSFALGDVPTALDLAEESEANLHSLGDHVSAARCRLVLGLIASARNDAEATSRWLEPAGVVFREHGLWFWAALSTIALGMIPYREGRYDTAESILAEGYHLSRSAGDRFSRYIALYDMSRLAQVRGELREAARLFHEGFVFSLEVGDRANMAYCLEGLASVAVMHHDPHLAARLLGRAESLFQAAGARVYAYRPDTSLRETTLETVEQQLAPDMLAFEWREGVQMSISDLLDLVLPLTDLAQQAAKPRIEGVAFEPDTKLRDVYGLTRRELEILRLLMNHYSNRQIADELFISPRTVSTHINAINRKLDVSSRHEAAHIAAQHGL